MSVFRKSLAVICIGFTLLSASPLHAATPITSASALTRESAPVIRSLPTPTARAWAAARIRLYTNTLKHAQKSYSADASAYKKEVGLDAEKFLRTLHEGGYEYDISDAERQGVEATILSYQKEMVHTLREYMTKIQSNDTRESGSMSMTFTSDELSFDLEFDPYTVTTSGDMRKTEVDIGIKYRIYGKGFDGKSASVYVRGKLLRIDNDLYITLQDYNILSTIEGIKMIEDAKKFLEKIKGKTYHQELDKEMAEAFQDSQKTIESTEKILKKNGDELTPHSSGTGGK